MLVPNIMWKVKVSKAEILSNIFRVHWQVKLENKGRHIIRTIAPLKLDINEHRKE